MGAVAQLQAGSQAENARGRGVRTAIAGQAFLAKRQQRAEQEQLMAKLGFEQGQQEQALAARASEGDASRAAEKEALMASLGLREREGAAGRAQQGSQFAAQLAETSAARAAEQGNRQRGLDLQDALNHGNLAAEDARIGIARGAQQHQVEMDALANKRIGEDRDISPERIRGKLMLDALNGGQGAPSAAPAAPEPMNGTVRPAQPVPSLQQAAANAPATVDTANGPLMASLTPPGNGGQPVAGAPKAFGAGMDPNLMAAFFPGYKTPQQQAHEKAGYDFEDQQRNLSLETQRLGIDKAKRELAMAQLGPDAQSSADDTRALMQAIQAGNDPGVALANINAQRTARHVPTVAKGANGDYSASYQPVAPLSLTPEAQQAAADVPLAVRLGRKTEAAGLGSPQAAASSLLTGFRAEHDKAVPWYDKLPDVFGGGAIRAATGEQEFSANDPWTGKPSDDQDVAKLLRTRPDLKQQFSEYAKRKGAGLNSSELMDALGLAY